MTEELIHQRYRDILAEMRAEAAANRNGKSQDENKSGTERIEDYIYFPRTPQKSGILSLEVRYLLIGFSISALIICGVIVFSSFQTIPKNQPVSEVKPASVSVVPTIRTEDTRLANDVDLIKKILSGLVQSVQVLSEEKARSEQKPNFPYPVKITSEKANLRSSPGLDSKSVGVVIKDTILLATSESNGWLKVSTPKGEEAWISQNIVAAKEE